ncbi:dethiobiotin synthase [Sporosarcina pasteurii]|uniref:ATP-dependent dethiobiotin synthetase BioD n=1 Tax=Sporosarcina pasteurii TaxID=1474 RepID=A0A380BCL5_SPOPA|nr:dethiobiotin synthase [Sporosarcina pasteurii]MDS9472840.1 dethiobiotin synthase [Sporosarcina pasteurii]QBQ06394.1 dethiobiotin synthase [Sporosarcina pasteurii]SUI98789.1 ATP-dependent dethiobiotin synthetase BioD 1 [Sporosarcina pasteurii]
MAGFFICGTDTDVGKTVATVLLGQALIDNGLTIDFYKPVQSGGESIDGQLIAPDVERYKAVLETETEKRYTYLFEKPSSPHYAAAIEGKSIDVVELERQLKRRASSTKHLLVEGAGGLYVPLNNEGYCVLDLIQAGQLPAVIVARTGVGTINHTILTIEALRSRGITIAGIVFSNTNNDEKAIKEDNIKMIKKLTNLPIIGTIPFTEHMEEKLLDQSFRSSIVSKWNIESLKEGDKYANSTVG